MGHMGPIRGGGGFPHWAWRQGWGLSPHSRRTPSPWKFSPTWGRGGGWHPLGLYKEGYTPPPFHIQYKFSLSIYLSPTSSGLPLLGVCTWLAILHHSTPSLCRNQDPNPSFFRCSPGSGPGGNIDCTVCV